MLSETDAPILETCVPYLPNKEILGTLFTSVDMSDLETHLRLLEERWKRFFPILDWRQLDFNPVPMTSGGEAYVAGVDGKTIINPVYNEAIPQGPNDNANPGVQYQSPHGGPVDATNRKIYKPTVPIHVQVKRIRPDNALTVTNKAGRSDARFILLCSLLDRAGITVNEGDQVGYRGTRYEIREAVIPEDGYWQQNTNIPLYVVCEAAIDHLGS